MWHGIPMPGASSVHAEEGAERTLMLRRACLPAPPSLPPSQACLPRSAADWREQAILRFRVMRKRALKQTIAKLAAALEAAGDDGSTAAAGEGERRCTAAPVHVAAPALPQPSGVAAAVPCTHGVSCLSVPW